MYCLKNNMEKWLAHGFDIQPVKNGFVYGSG